MGPSEVVESFKEVGTILDREGDQSRDSGGVFRDHLADLGKVLGNELARSAHGAERAEEVLLAGVSFDEAQLVNGDVFVEDEIGSTLIQVAVNLFNVGAFLRISQGINVPCHIR